MIFFDVEAYVMINDKNGVESKVYVIIVDC